MPLNPKDKKIILDYLNSQRLMAIATYGEIPWIATVYYVVDDNLNLYFISPAEARHSGDISKNPDVACAVADSRQGAGEKKVGLYLYGKAKQEGVLQKIRWMLAIYDKLHPSVRDKLNFRNFQAKVMTSKVYKVTPKRIKFFNERLYPSKNERVFIP